MTRTFPACALVVCLALPLPARAQAVTTPDVWQAFAEKVEPGKTLKIRLKGGDRFKATLLQVSAGGMIVQPKTRAAVPPQRIAFEHIETIETDDGRGLGIGKAIAIGAGVAAGAFFSLMVLAFAVWGD